MQHSTCQKQSSRLPAQIAEQYLELGLSLVPIRGKTPAVQWSELQNRKPTASEIDDWFGPRARERFNVGIICGRISGIVVVDTDSPEDAEFWKENFPATPAVVKSGGESSGLHFYYRYPENVEAVRNRVHVLGRAIDLRADGGIVVAPPSLHPETGRAYEWLLPLEKFSFANIPKFEPEWIPEAKPSLPKRPILAPGEGQQDQAIQRARSYIATIKAVSGEGGDRQTFRAICKLRDFGLTEEQASEVIQLWNETNASPPWELAPLIHKIQVAFQQGK